MLVENQYIQLKWNGGIKKLYEDKGYKFTKINDTFWIHAEDLMPSSKKEVDIRCDYCGKVYELPFYIHSRNIKNNNKYCCFKCRDKRTKERHLKRKQEQYYIQYKELCEKNGYKMITEEGEISHVNDHIQFYCPYHGKQSLEFNRFKNGARCKLCRDKENAEKRKLSVTDVEAAINGKNNNIWINVDEYINARVNNLKIKCGSCGNIFTSSLTNYKRSENGRCKKCSMKMSAGELRIETFLIKHKIKYKWQKKFENCKDVALLPFDFYLYDYNLIVEFDGQQHFEPRFGKECFEKTIKHDRIKNQYCIDNGIRILRISYLQGNYIERILTEELNLKNVA